MPSIIAFLSSMTMIIRLGVHVAPAIGTFAAAATAWIRATTSFLSCSGRPTVAGQIGSSNRPSSASKLGGMILSRYSFAGRFGSRLPSMTIALSFAADDCAGGGAAAADEKATARANNTGIDASPGVPIMDDLLIFTVAWLPERAGFDERLHETIEVPRRSPRRHRWVPAVG